MIKKGTLLSARVPLRGFVALRVVEVDPETITALTVEGDPLAGIVTLRFRDQRPGIRVEIVVEAGATSLVDRVLAVTGGGALEDLDWPGALDRIVALSGGRAPAGPQRDVQTLDDDEAEQREAAGGEAADGAQARGGAAQRCRAHRGRGPQTSANRGGSGFPSSRQELTADLTATSSCLPPE
jgi:hypothetical protein